MEVVRRSPERAGEPARNGLVSSVVRSTAGRSYGVGTTRVRLRTSGVTGETDGVEVGAESRGAASVGDDGDVSTRGDDGEDRRVERDPLERGPTSVGVDGGDDVRDDAPRLDRPDEPDDGDERDDAPEEPDEDDRDDDPDERPADDRDDRDEPPDEAPDDRDDPDELEAPDERDPPDDDEEPRLGEAEEPRFEPDDDEEEAPFLPPRRRECETPFFAGAERVLSTEDDSPREAAFPFFPPFPGEEANPSPAESRSAAPARVARARRETGRSRLGIAVLREAARGRLLPRATDERRPGFREF